MATKQAIKDQIDALTNFRTRSDAIQALVAGGKDAVSPVMELLESNNEAIRWCAVRILGEIGTEAAIERLRTLQDDKQLASVVGEALRKHQIADDVGARDLRPGENRFSADELLTGLAKRLHASVERHDDEVHTVSLPGGADLTTTVRFPETAEGGRVVTVMVETGLPALPEVFERALVWNAQLPQGAVAIATIGGAAQFVLVDTHARETLDPLELVRCVSGMAANAGKIRALLAKIVQEVAPAESADAPAMVAPADS